MEKRNIAFLSIGRPTLDFTIKNSIRNDIADQMVNLSLIVPDIIPALFKAGSTTNSETSDSNLIIRYTTASQDFAIASRNFDKNDNPVNSKVVFNLNNVKGGGRQKKISGSFSITFPITFIFDGKEIDDFSAETEQEIGLTFSNVGDLISLSPNDKENGEVSVLCIFNNVPLKLVPEIFE